ncbi:MAG: alginate biosynthesis protein [Pseudomonadota bacterium]
MRHVFLASALLGSLSSPSLADPLEQYFAPSAYGCRNLQADPQTPILEGKDGVFYRVYADIRMQHPMSDRAVGLMAQLSERLAARGTTLVFAPVPTKSLAMPEQLPDVAELYGYDLGIARAVYDDVIARLEASGVVSVNLADAMHAPDVEGIPFFKTDFHWTAEGARRAASAIADRLGVLPGFDEIEKTDFETVPMETAVAFSGLRRETQIKCAAQVPEPITMTWATSAVASGAAGGGAIDLFGGGASDGTIAIAGTSFSDMAIANFDGWLSQYSGLETANYAITGGNQFGAMLSYLTSDEFDEAPPRFLIWENPIYNNLMQYGDWPMLELIAAAQGACTSPVAFRKTEDRQIEATLSGLNLAAGAMLYLDAGREGLRDIALTFALADGSSRSRYRQRGERLRATGRFYVPFGGLGPSAPTRVVIDFDRPVPDTTTLSICNLESY